MSTELKLDSNEKILLLTLARVKHVNSFSELYEAALPEDRPDIDKIVLTGSRFSHWGLVNSKTGSGWDITDKGNQLARRLEGNSDE